MKHEPRYADLMTALHALRVPLRLDEYELRSTTPDDERIPAIITAGKLRRLRRAYLKAKGEPC